MTLKIELNLDDYYPMEDSIAKTIHEAVLDEIKRHVKAEVKARLQDKRAEVMQDIDALIKRAIKERMGA